MLSRVFILLGRLRERSYWILEVKLWHDPLSKREFMKWRRSASPRHERAKVTCKNKSFKRRSQFYEILRRFFLTDFKYHRLRIVLRFLNVSLEGYAIKEKQCCELSLVVAWQCGHVYIDFKEGCYSEECCSRNRPLYYPDLAPNSYYFSSKNYIYLRRNKIQDR